MNMTSTFAIAAVFMVAGAVFTASIMDTGSTATVMGVTALVEHQHDYADKSMRNIAEMSCPGHPKGYSDTYTTAEETEQVRATLHCDHFGL